MRSMSRLRLVTVVTAFLLLVTQIAHADYTVDGSTAKGNVTIESVEAAQKLRGISRIVGNLVIQNYDAADLAPLASLTMIEGSLIISTNATLTSLAGLGKLERVYGIVWIFSNPKLASLAGLAALQSAERALTVTDNASLTSLLPAGITIGEPIKNIRGSLTIRGNASLPATIAEDYAKKCKVGGQVDVTNNKRRAP